jgi:hypothetical protein
MARERIKQPLIVKRGDREEIQERTSMKRTTLKYYDRSEMYSQRIVMGACRSCGWYHEDIDGKPWWTGPCKNPDCDKYRSEH